MEKQMEQCAREMMRDPSVRGVVCSDSNGALYCGAGTLENAHSAAVASQLANLAGALEPNSQPIAVVLSSSPPVQNLPPSSFAPITGSFSHSSGTHGNKVLIKRNGPITVAVHK